MAQYGPHRWVGDEQSEVLRGKRFAVADLAGARFVDCDLTGVKITETLRHLIFIADSWAARTVLDEPSPYHRLGLPQTAYPPPDAAALGMDLGAHPSWAEVIKVRGERMALVRGLVEGLTDDELTRPVTRAPAPGYPDEERTAGGCLEVVMDEECEHYRFATRDLAVLEAGPPPQ